MIREKVFTPKQLEKYADVLVWGMTTARSGKFKKGDVISVRYDLDAMDLAEYIQEKLLIAGLNPVMRPLLSPKMEINSLSLGNEKQLTFQTPGIVELCSNLNGSIYVHAPESLTHLKDVDPERIAKSIKSRKNLKDIMDARDEQGEFGWTLCTYPTKELAKHAGLGFDEYKEQIIKACYLNRPDPVGEWKKVFEKAKDIKKWLNGMPVDYYHVESQNCDLQITPGKDRRWIGISGHNIPSFELFISPDWRGTKGVYYANLPSFRLGNIVEGVRIEFAKGRAVKYSAQKGDAFFKKQLEMDKGAKQLGEFSLTDTRFSKIDRFMADTLFDENFGGKFGNCHVAVGSSYSDTYAGDITKLDKELKKELGFNDSSLHWDLVNTEDKVVTAVLEGGKKEVVYKKGRFCV